MSAIYGYARCSTNDSKQDITRQIRELEKLGVTKESIYTEYESGTKRDRIELNRLLEILEPKDTLITTELSRISRSMKDLINILDILKNKQVKVLLGKFTLDFSTGNADPIVVGMVNMMAVFAQMERDIISQRTKSGMENAKANGKVIGRPKLTSDNIPNIFLKHYPSYINKAINISEFSRICNVSRTTIYKYINLIEDKKS